MSSPDTGKRRVVRGRQDRLEPKHGQKNYVPQDYGKIVADSSTDTLKNMYSGETDYQVPSDQYHDKQDVANVQSPTYKSVKFAQGSDQAQPPRIQIQKLNTQPQASTSAGLTKQQIRRKQIQDVMSKYEAANKQAAHNKAMSALTSVPLALTNPQAARIRQSGYEQQDNEPLTSITGGRADQASYLKNADQTADLADQDDQRDPDSRVSELYRQQLTNRGIKFTGKPSAADIKKVYPMIGAGIKQDTSMYNTDTVAQTADQNRMSRQEQKDLDRGAAQKRTQTIAGSGIQRGREHNATQMFITGLRAQAAQNTAAGNAARKDLNTLKQRQVPGLKMVDPDRKIPSSIDHNNAAKIMSVEPAIKQLAGQAIQSLTKDPRNFPFTPQGKLMAGKLIMVTKLMNKGLLAEGVTNGKDMQYGLQMVVGGNVNGWNQWLTAGGSKILQGFLSNMDVTVNSALKGYGYEKGIADYDLSDFTSGSGGGGGQSGRDSVLTPQDSADLSRLGTGGLDVTPQPRKKPNPPPTKPGGSAKQRLKAKLGVK